MFLTNSPVKNAQVRKKALIDKMALKVVNKLKVITHVSDPKGLSAVIRSQVENILLNQGTVLEKDLTGIATRMKHELEGRQVLAGAGADGGKAIEGSVVSRAKSDKKGGGSQVNGGKLKPLKHNAEHQRPGWLEQLDPIKPSSDVCDMAKQVRNLPPLQQKRLLLQKAQGPRKNQANQQAVDAEKEADEEKRVKAQQKQEQRAYLDMQVQKRKEAAEVEKLQLKEHALEEANQREKWKEEELASVRRRKEETAVLAKELAEQRELSMKRKLTEQEQYNREEADRVKQIQLELQLDDEKKTKQKEKLQKEVKNFMQYNIAQEKVKQQEKKKLQELDVVLQKEYAKKLEQQELDRMESLKKVSQRQAKRYDVANARYKTWQEQQQKDEEKAQQHQEAEDARAKADDDARKQKQAVEIRKIKQSVAEQIKEKEKQRIFMKTEALRLKNEMVKAVKAAEDKEKAIRAEQRAFARKGMIEIDRQLVEQHERRFKPNSIKVGERLERLPVALLVE